MANNWCRPRKPHIASMSQADHAFAAPGQRLEDGAHAAAGGSMRTDEFRLGWHPQWCSSGPRGLHGLIHRRRSGATSRRSEIDDGMIVRSGVGNASQSWAASISMESRVWRVIVAATYVAVTAFRIRQRAVPQECRIDYGDSGARGSDGHGNGVFPTSTRRSGAR